MKKRIVVFYSLTGNTKEAAQTIAARLGAELCEIRTVKSMPKGKFACIMKGGGQAAFGKKPKILPLEKELTAYDEIILGTPVWAGKNAAPVNTLLANEAIRPAVRALFTFSGGGDNEKCVFALKKKLPGLSLTVALADRTNGLSKQNAAKIEEFISALQAAGE